MWWDVETEWGTRAQSSTVVTRDVQTQCKFVSVFSMSIYVVWFVLPSQCLVRVLESVQCVQCTLYCVVSSTAVRLSCSRLNYRWLSSTVVRGRFYGSVVAVSWFFDIRQIWRFRLSRTGVDSIQEEISNLRFCSIALIKLWQVTKYIDVIPVQLRSSTKTKTS